MSASAVGMDDVEGFPAGDVSDAPVGAGRQADGAVLPLYWKPKVVAEALIRFRRVLRIQQAMTRT